MTGPRWLLWRAALVSEDPVLAYAQLRHMTLDEIVAAEIIGTAAIRSKAPKKKGAP